MNLSIAVVVSRIGRDNLIARLTEHEDYFSGHESWPDVYPFPVCFCLTTKSDGIGEPQHRVEWAVLQLADLEDAVFALRPRAVFPDEQECRCVVACRDGKGSSQLVPVAVFTRDADPESEDVCQIAADAARREGFDVASDAVVVYDVDSPDEGLFENGNAFDWDTAICGRA